MTEPDLNAAEQEAVRRRLADARHDEPMPTDVVERLDEVLAGLAADRAGGDEVIPIGSARTASHEAGPTRHGRRWPAYLLSAAAVVAIGFGVSQMVPGDPDSGDDNAGSSAAGDAQPNMAPSEDDENRDSGPRSEAKNEAPATSSDRFAAKSFPLPDIRGLSPRDARNKELGTAQKLSQLKAARLTKRCVPHDIPKTSVVRAASFQGKDAVVVYLPPNATERRVEVYVCGSSSDEPVRTSTLPPKE